MIVIFPIILISSISLIGVIVKIANDRHKKSSHLVHAHPDFVILMINGTEFKFPYETNKVKRMELAMAFCSSQGNSLESTWKRLP